MTSFLSTENYQVFRECLSTAIVERFSAPAQPKKARRTRGAVSQRQKTRKETAGTSAAAADASQCLPDRASPEELAEFIDVRGLVDWCLLSSSTLCCMLHTQTHSTPRGHSMHAFTSMEQEYQ